jgi:Tfp pilus assembly protein PilF
MKNTQAACRKTLTATLLAGCVLLLSACATPPAQVSTVDTLFDNSRFNAALAPSLPDVFALTPSMQSHLNSDTFRARLHRQDAARGLVAALYDGGGLKLEYDSSHTRTAAEAFADRRGNCLSLVLMTAAFARSLGVPVRFNLVLADETWQRSGELVVTSAHVNITLGRPNPAMVPDDGQLTIDFLPGADVAGYRSVTLEESTVVAMVFNNRAVEAMLAGQLDSAYWWARAALMRDPAYTAPYNTLAVIYQHHGDTVLAERSWRLALAREPENAVVMQNLAPLLASTGRQPEADAMLLRAARIEPTPPFHFYRLGMQAMQNGDFAAARKAFAREVARAPYHDEFHFWLGMALLRLGRHDDARAQLAQAAQHSASAEMRGLYTAKLDMLRRGPP